MAVQRYSKQEMQAIISSILSENIRLVPIGNHEIKRHLVYKVETKDHVCVFKYYYQSQYGGREISTLKLLEGSSIKHAPLEDSGTFGEEREWLMMTLLHGMPLDKIMSKIDRFDLLDIFHEMGIQLAKLHELKTFEQFGNLTAEMAFEKTHKNFQEAFLDASEYVHEKIQTNAYEDKNILLRGIAYINRHLGLLDHVTRARLTHLDYSPRNIFVEKIGHQRRLAAVLDFELCRPWDKNADFSQLYLKHFDEDPELKNAFFEGYNKFSSLDDTFKKTFDFYMVNLCLNICSWSQDLAPDYYHLAIHKLKNILKSE